MAQPKKVLFIPKIGNRIGKIVYAFLLFLASCKSQNPSSDLKLHSNVENVCQKFGFNKDVSIIADFSHKSWQNSTHYQVRLKPVGMKLTQEDYLAKKTFSSFEVFDKSTPEAENPKNYVVGYDDQKNPILYEDILNIPFELLSDRNQKESCNGAKDIIDAFRQPKGNTIEKNAKAFIQDLHFGRYKRNLGQDTKSAFELPPIFQLNNATRALKIWEALADRLLPQNYNIDREAVIASLKKEVQRARGLLRESFFSADSFKELLWKVPTYRRGGVVFSNPLIKEYMRELYYLRETAIEESSLNARAIAELATAMSQKRSLISTPLGRLIKEKILPRIPGLEKIQTDNLIFRTPDVAAGIAGAVFLVFKRGVSNTPGALLAAVKLQKGVGKEQSEFGDGLKEVVGSQIAQIIFEQTLGTKNDNDAQYNRIMLDGVIGSLSNPSENDIFYQITSPASGSSMETLIADTKIQDMTEKKRQEIAVQVGKFLANIHAKWTNYPTDREQLENKGQIEKVSQSNLEYELIVFQNLVIGPSEPGDLSESNKNLGSALNLEKIGALKNAQEFRNKLQSLLRAYSRSLYTGRVASGFTHGDLHSGNLFIDLTSAGQPKLSFIDYGDAIWSAFHEGAPGIGDSAQDAAHLLGSIMIDSIKSNSDNSWSSTPKLGKWEIGFMTSLLKSYLQKLNLEFRTRLTKRSDISDYKAFYWKSIQFYASRFMANQLLDAQRKQPFKNSCEKLVERKVCTKESLIQEMANAWADFLMLNPI